MEIPQQVLDDIIHIIVEAVHPLKIILFGSAARGEWRQDSDVDVLVLMPDGTHRRKAAQEIYRHTGTLPCDVDAIVATESDLARYGDNYSLIYYPALREGRPIYGG